MLVNEAFLHHFILHVVLGSCYEERLLTMEVVEQLPEVNIALIHEIVTARLYRNQAHSLGVVDSSLCQIDEGYASSLHLCHDAGVPTDRAEGTT